MDNFRGIKYFYSESLEFWFWQLHKGHHTTQQLLISFSAIIILET